MKASCNGCRVLRKGCRDDCELRDCLEWIRNSQAQANATVFLAKFYGRAGLINLINAGPPDQRATIFRSLLYEACGRAIDPVFGSLGLVCSGNWHLWHAAVQSVLNGCCFASAEAAFPANPSVNPLTLKQTTKFKARKNPTTAVHDKISRRQSRQGRECRRFLPLHDDEVVSATQLDSDEKQNSNEDKQQNLRRAVDDLELGLSLSSSTPASLIR